MSQADIADWLSIVGAIATLVTLLRVQRIARARREERSMLERALRLRDLNWALARNAELLSNNAPAVDPHKVSRELLSLSAELDAAIRILLPEDAPDGTIAGIETFEDGYWTDQFADACVGRARRRLIMVCWRNSRALKEQTLGRILEQLANHPGLVVRIYAMSVNAPEVYYEDMARLLELGDAQTMRSQQRHHLAIAEAIIARRLKDGSLDQSVVRRFEYYEYSCAPLLHACVVDDEVTWGINFFMDRGLGSTNLLSRAYVRTRSTGSFGCKVQEQVDIIHAMASTTRVNWEEDVDEARARIPSRS